MCKLIYSYGEFLLKFPKATRKQRQEAVKRFYDFIKGDVKYARRDHFIEKKKKNHEHI